MDDGPGLSGLKAIAGAIRNGVQPAQTTRNVDVRFESDRFIRDRGGLCKAPSPSRLPSRRISTAGVEA
jgi:hypothetical protein